MKTTIQTNGAPAAIGPYSQATAGGQIICVSGQLPIEPISGEIPPELDQQVRQCMRNILSIVTAAGSSAENILKCGLFIRNMEDFSKINTVYQEFFDNAPPARFVVEVSRLPKDALIEIDAIATT